ncbi:SMI1/KNR4 family protein [Pseudoalteromonas rhizosphaerae]|uniref:SMI1/KNR4 family protein n=1 Tax=Pseudoalteromonas rhizosphaerae TaxID=2518973 RepID=A0ABW8KV48_9GAMM
MKLQKKQNFMSRVGGAEEQEIIDLQSYYKITLLDDYKHFLKSFGFCAWFGDYICGLPEESFRFKKSLSVYNKTNYFIDFYKEHELQAVSKRGVIINKYDGGGYYFLFSKESGRAGEVGLFLTETYGQEVSKFKSFTDYLSFLVTGTPDPDPVDVDYDKIIDIIED